MPNQANLEATLAAIEANPGHWNQDHWHCGTSHCFAGFAEMLRLGLNPCEAVRPGDWLIDGYATAEWLGLSWDQWVEITDCGNSLDDLRRMVKNGFRD